MAAALAAADADRAAAVVAVGELQARLMAEEDRSRALSERLEATEEAQRAAVASLAAAQAGADAEAARAAAALAKLAEGTRTHEVRCDGPPGCDH